MNDHDVDTIMNVLGNGDRNLKMISDALKCELTVEDNKVLVSDEDKFFIRSQLPMGSAAVTSTCVPEDRRHFMMPLKSMTSPS